MSEEDELMKKRPYEKGSLYDKLWEGYRNLKLPNFSDEDEKKIILPSFYLSWIEVQTRQRDLYYWARNAWVGRK